MREISNILNFYRSWSINRFESVAPDPDVSVFTVIWPDGPEAAVKLKVKVKK